MASIDVPDGQRRSSPTVQLVWPLAALESIPAAPKCRTAIILCAENADEIQRHVLDTGLAMRLVESGAGLFAFVGEESEKAHDALDWVLVDAGADEVLTTWHDVEDLEHVAYTVVPFTWTDEVTRIIVAWDETTKSWPGLRDALAEAVRAHRT